MRRDSVNADCANEGLGSYCYASHCTTSCDPPTGAGCGGEACGIYTGNPPAPEPMVDFTDCHAPGAIQADQMPCAEERDCAAGTACILGTCRRACDPLAGPGACAAGLSCYAMAPIVNALTSHYGVCCNETTGC